MKEVCGYDEVIAFPVAAGGIKRMFVIQVNRGALGPPLLSI